MKKLLVIIQLVLGVALYSSYASAGDHHGHHDHGWEHHHHHHPDRVYYRDVVRYYPAPRPVVRQVVRYYPAPRPVVRQVVRYYPQPAPVYYAPQPQYQSYAPSTNGLAGGVIGSVFGYQLGGGDPLATGIGAAAGSYLGNGVVGR